MDWYTHSSPAIVYRATRTKFTLYGTVLCIQACPYLWAQVLETATCMRKFKLLCLVAITPWRCGSYTGKLTILFVGIKSVHSHSHTLHYCKLGSEAAIPAGFTSVRELQVPVGHPPWPAGLDCLSASIIWADRTVMPDLVREANRLNQLLSIAYCSMPAVGHMQHTKHRLTLCPEHPLFISP